MTFKNRFSKFAALLTLFCFTLNQTTAYNNASKVLNPEGANLFHLTTQKLQNTGRAASVFSSMSVSIKNRAELRNFEPALKNWIGQIRGLSEVDRERLVHEFLPLAYAPSFQEVLASTKINQRLSRLRAHYRTEASDHFLVKHSAFVDRIARTLGFFILNRWGTLSLVAGIVVWVLFKVKQRHPPSFYEFSLVILLFTFFSEHEVKRSVFDRLISAVFYSTRRQSITSSGIIAFLRQEEARRNGLSFFTQKIQVDPSGIAGPTKVALPYQDHFSILFEFYDERVSAGTQFHLNGFPGIWKPLYDPKENQVVYVHNLGYVQGDYFLLKLDQPETIQYHSSVLAEPVKFSSMIFEENHQVAFGRHFVGFLKSAVSFSRFSWWNQSVSNESRTKLWLLEPDFKDLSERGIAAHEIELDANANPTSTENKRFNFRIPDVRAYLPDLIGYSPDQSENQFVIAEFGRHRSVEYAKKMIAGLKIIRGKKSKFPHRSKQTIKRILYYIDEVMEPSDVSNNTYTEEQKNTIIRETGKFTQSRVGITQSKLLRTSEKKAVILMLSTAQFIANKFQEFFRAALKQESSPRELVFVIDAGIFLSSEELKRPIRISFRLNEHGEYVISGNGFELLPATDQLLRSELRTEKSSWIKARELIEKIAKEFGDRQLAFANESTINNWIRELNQIAGEEKNPEFSNYLYTTFSDGEIKKQTLSPGEAEFLEASHEVLNERYRLIKRISEYGQSEALNQNLVNLILFATIHPDINLRTFAARLIGRLHGIQEMKLEETLKNIFWNASANSPFVRIAASQSLTELGDYSVGKVLIDRFVREKDISLEPAIVEAAIDQIVRISNKSVLQKIRYLAFTQEDHLVALTLEALRKNGDPESVPIFAVYLDSDASAIKQTAMKGFYELVQKAIDASKSISNLRKDSLRIISAIRTMQSESRYLEAARLADFLKLDSTDRVLAVGAGLDSELLVASAIRGARVDVVQPPTYAHLNQTETLKQKIWFDREAVRNQFRVDLIGNHIDTQSFRTRVEDAQLKPGSYSTVFLFSVLDDPRTYPYHRQILETIYDAMSNEGRILITNLTGNLSEIGEVVRDNFESMGGSITTKELPPELGGHPILELKIKKPAQPASGRSELRKNAFKSLNGRAEVESFVKTMSEVVKQTARAFLRNSSGFNLAVFKSDAEVFILMNNLTKAGGGATPILARKLAESGKYVVIVAEPIVRDALIKADEILGASDRIKIVSAPEEAMQFLNRSKKKITYRRALGLKGTADQENAQNLLVRDLADDKEMVDSFDELLSLSGFAKTLVSQFHKVYEAMISA